MFKSRIRVATRRTNAQVFSGVCYILVTLRADEKQVWLLVLGGFELGHEFCGALGLPYAYLGNFFLLYRK